MWKRERKVSRMTKVSDMSNLAHGHVMHEEPWGQSWSSRKITNSVLDGGFDISVGLLNGDVAYAAGYKMFGADYIPLGAFGKWM